MGVIIQYTTQPFNNNINFCYRLNLILVDTAKTIKEVSDFFGAMEITYRFFSASVLRHGRFVKIQKDKGLKVLEIPHLSDTRWACRFFAVNLY